MSARLLFEDATTGLWAYGEAAATAVNLAAVTLGNPGAELVVSGGLAFFAVQAAGAPAGTATALWVSDGTAAGTTQIATLPDNTASGFDIAGIYGLTPLSNGAVLFDAYDGTADAIYVSDGVTTAAVAGYAGGGPALGSAAAELAGSLLFTDVSSGLWAYREAAGTLDNLAALTLGNAGGHVVVAGARAFLAAHAAGAPVLTETALGTTDGTAAGTRQIAVLPDNTPSGAQDIAGIYAIQGLAGGTVAFDYYDGISEAAWVSDGTAAGTKAMPGYTGGAPALGPGAAAELNGALLFTDATTGLWSYDEATGTATHLASFTLGNAGGHLAVAGNRAYFAAQAPGAPALTETALWTTDGTAGGTRQIATLPDNTPNGAQDVAGIYGLTALADGSVAIAAYDGAATTPWLSDGTTTAPLSGFSGTSAALGPGSSAELPAPCFATGTRIATPHGLRPVETLRPGDLVLTLDGPAPVVWLGRRAVDCRRHPDPREVWPVRLAPHALGSGSPARPLLLSPDHAVLIDGVLIPVRHLLNGRTIRGEPCSAVTYWHVELPGHAILAAEGLPCESYLDTGNRGDFDNAPPTARADTAAALARWRNACAPLVTAGPRLAAARAFALAQAATLGHARTAEPDLRLRAGGRDILPERHGRTLRFVLPPGSDSCRLRSRSAVPAEVEEASPERRRLGVAVAALRHAGIPLSLADRRLGAGWHAVETGGPATWRWTDGDALLALGPGPLEIDLALTARYWEDAAPARPPVRATLRKISSCPSVVASQENGWA